MPLYVDVTCVKQNMILVVIRLIFDEWYKILFQDNYQIMPICSVLNHANLVGSKAHYMHNLVQL